MNKPVAELIECTFQAHGEQVRDIFNDAILTSTALYDYQPRSIEQVAQWFDAKAQLELPVLGVVSKDGQLQAFGSYGPFRHFPAYKYTAEHSVYVARHCRGQGIGKSLLKALIERAREDQLHALIGAIDAENRVSCAMHERLGFECVGKLPQVGFKFGRWLDLALYQLLLETPIKPVDG